MRDTGMKEGSAKAQQERERERERERETETERERRRCFPKWFPVFTSSEAGKNRSRRNP